MRILRSLLNLRARLGRNPATSFDLMLSARKVDTFKCSGKLRDKNKESPFVKNVHVVPNGPDQDRAKFGL